MPMPGIAERLEHANGVEKRPGSHHGSLLSQALRGDSTANGHSHGHLAGSMHRGAASHRSSEESLHSLDLHPEPQHSRPMPRTNSNGHQPSPAEVNPLELSVLHANVRCMWIIALSAVCDTQACVLLHPACLGMATVGRLTKAGIIEPELHSKWLHRGLL